MLNLVETWGNNQHLSSGTKCSRVFALNLFFIPFILSNGWLCQSDRGLDAVKFSCLNWVGFLLYILILGDVRAFHAGWGRPVLVFTGPWLARS